MTTKTVTKKMIVNAIKKDLVLLNKQKKATKDYIKAGCGQFLNVGNDQWCGGYDSVVNLYDDMIYFAKETIKNLNSLKKEPTADDLFDVIDDIFDNIADASEANVFLCGEKEPYDGMQTHHGLFPNFSKLL